MPAFQFFDKFPGRLGDGSVSLGVHQLWAYLTNTTPDQALDSYRSDLADIGTQNGYTTGGQQMGTVTWTEQAGSPQGIWVYDCADFSWTASGGSIGPAQYLVFYLKGAGSPNEYLTGFVNYGAPFTITDGNSLNVTVTNGLFDLARAGV
jgi:hypothetical protein